MVCVMAQNSFGRRNATLGAFGALGCFLTPSGATRVDTASSTPKITGTPPAPAECRGKPDCKNEYSVELRCGEGDEPKTASVVASSVEAANVTAERYNRGCRARRTFFAAVITQGPSGTSKVAAAALAATASEPVRSSRGGRRMRRR